MKKLIRKPVFPAFIALIFLAFSCTARAQTIVCLETTLGDVCMELFDTEAPVAAQNFLAYVQQGSYANSFFHLSVKDGPVYVQAGRYAATGAPGLDGLQEIFRRPPVTGETGIANTRGTVALVPDDPDNPGSATSQFLINVADNSADLDGADGYTVFARVLGEGMDFIDLLATFPLVSFDNDGLGSVPVIGQEVPVLNSPRVDIFDAFIYDGDISDFEPGGGSGDGDGGDGDGGDPGTGGDGDGGEPPTPGEGQTLYEDAACVDTNVGEFCMELFPGIAPNTVANFLNYIANARYDDTFVHRSVPNFVIQAGGYLSNPIGTPVPKDAAVLNEFNLSNLRGTVAMARLGGVVNSATSEWFVNLVDNTQLNAVDGGFTVFARVITGMDVVDQIGGLPRVNLQSSLGGAFGEVPVVEQDTDGVDEQDLVLIHRVYITDVVADDDDNGGGDGGTDPGDGIETTTEYFAASGSMRMPILHNGELYLISLFQDVSAKGIVFKANTTNIISLVDSGQDRAVMDLAAGTLTIPSVRVGTVIISDVVLTLTDLPTLTFKLQSYTRP